MRTWLILITAVLCLAGCMDLCSAQPPAAGTSSRDVLLAPRADGTVDLQGYIQAHLDSGERKVVVPPGRYRVAPKDKVHLRLSKLENVEIVMKGVEMVCTETTRAVSISQCKNLRLSGLAIDYDPLPFTEARITATGPKKEWLEFEILKGYPENKLEERIAIFDANTGELKVPSRYDWQPLERIGAGKYRIRRGPDYRFNPQVVSEAVGDFLVTNSNCAPGGQIPHAVVGDDNTAVTVEDVTLYAANAFGFVEHHCDRTTYLRCRLEPRSPENDPVKREWKRLRSGNADGFHSIGATRGPQIISCHASCMDDDGVNIHGAYAMVVSSEGNAIRLLGDRKPEFHQDDPLELMTYDGVRLPDGVLVGEPIPDGNSTPAIATFFSKQHLIGRIKESLSNPGVAVWKITVRDPVSLPMGSVVAAINRMGSGFVVKDSIFGPNRSRGILIKASQGIISGNTCRGNWMPGILVSPEWFWLEAGSSDDLVISGNTITGCRQTSILIHAQAGSGKPAPAGAHNRITVQNNTITTDQLPALHVSSVKDGSVKGNTITTTATGEAISLTHNENVEVRDNTINQSKPSTKEQP